MSREADTVFRRGRSMDESTYSTSLLSPDSLGSVSVLPYLSAYRPMGNGLWPSIPASSSGTSLLKRTRSEYPIVNHLGCRVVPKEE